MTEREKSEVMREAELKRIKKFYEDDMWLVVIPKSMDAACYWGSDTEWCTATRNEEDNYFDKWADEIEADFEQLKLTHGYDHSFREAKASFLGFWGWFAKQNIAGTAM